MITPACNVLAQKQAVPNVELRTSCTWIRKTTSVWKSVLMECLKTRARTCVLIAMKTAKLVKIQLMLVQVVIKQVNGRISSTTTVSMHAPQKSVFSSATNAWSATPLARPVQAKLHLAPLVNHTWSLTLQRELVLRCVNSKLKFTCPT